MVIDSNNVGQPLFWRGRLLSPQAILPNKDPPRMSLEYEEVSIDCALSAFEGMLVPDLYTPPPLQQEHP